MQNETPSGEADKADQDPGTQPLDTASPQETTPAPRPVEVPLASTPIGQYLAPVAGKRRSSQKLALLAVVLLLAAAGGAAYYALALRPESAGPDRTASTTPATVPASKPKPKSSAAKPYHYYEQSSVVNGLTFGYAKKAAVSRTTGWRSWFEGVAHAETAPAYRPVIFYKGKSAKDGEQIFRMYTDAGTNQQVTHDSANTSTPVFSSTAQKLAYKSGCNIAVAGLDGSNAKTVQKGSADKCYAPVAWSPDGTKLAYVSTYSTTSDLGLVSYSDLAVYDAAAGTAANIKAPAGFDSVDGSEMTWLDDGHLAVHYVKRGQFARTDKEELTNVDVAANTTKTLSDKVTVKVSTVQTIGGTLYATSGGVTGQLLAGQAIGGTMKPLSASKDVSTFLIKPTTDGMAADSIEAVVGGPGAENGRRLVKLNPADGKSSEQYVPKGFSTYMLGWNGDYDKVIYMNGVSQKNEIRQYTISSQKDELLVGDVPFIQ